MTTTAKLLFFAGSARKDSHNKRLAKLGATIAEANGITTTFADLANFPMPVYNGDDEVTDGPPENAKKFSSLISQHNAVVIACPEYNASITPLLKNTLDWVSRVRNNDGSATQPYKNCVFALCSASPGGMGGLRGLVIVRHFLEQGLGALVIPDQFALPRAMNAYDEDGHLSDKEAQGRFKDMIEKLANTAAALHG